jgi:hypothetical protein
MKAITTAAALAVLVAAGIAGGAGSGSRVIDRTLLCRATGAGFPDPVRILGLSVTPRVGKKPPLVNLWNGTGPEGINAGFTTGPYAGTTTGRLWFSRSSCTASTRPVALSGSGLTGGRPAFSVSHRCEIPAQLLLRIRAVFTRPVTLARDAHSPYILVGKGRISAGQLAVTTVRGDPIAFASVDEATAKTRIFTSASRCHRD